MPKQAGDFFNKRVDGACFTAKTMLPLRMRFKTFLGKKRGIAFITKISSL
jgi:hypothetical protein